MNEIGRKKRKQNDFQCIEKKIIYIFFTNKVNIENPETSSAGVSVCLVFFFFFFFFLFFCKFPFLFRALHFNGQNSFLCKLMVSFPKFSGKRLYFLK